MAETTTQTAPEAINEGRRALVRARRQGLRPPPTLSVPEWADRFRKLSREAGSTGGAWSTSRVEIARGPMLAVTEPGVRTITVRCCTQLMKTAFLENVFGYFAHLDPSPILLVQPKDEAVEAFSKERIAPMVAATPVLRQLVGDGKTRSSGDTLRFKKFPGGFLAMVSAGSPTNLAMRPIRVTLFDEINKYEATKEGDAVTLGEERSATFPNNSLSARVCSPTIEGSCRITQSYEEGDQRQAFLACPHCGEEQVLEFFKSVLWQKTESGAHRPETAAVYCEHCGAAWSEAERLRALQGVKWRQTRKFECCGKEQDPIATRSWRWVERYRIGYATCVDCGRDAVSNKHASFTASKLHSPWKPVADVAEKWLLAKEDDELRKTFFNTQLGLPYRPAAGKELARDKLLARRERYAAQVPEGVAVLTAGVDVQDDRLEYEVVGWGRDEESWSVEVETIVGDPAAPDVWEALDRKLLERFKRADGRELTIEATCIDSGGHHTQAAYKFAKARAGRRVWAIKGASDRFGQTSPVWPRYKPKRTSTTFRPVMIGVNAAKDRIRSWLHVSEPGPGFCHFPHDRDASYFDQLLAERYEIQKVGQIKGRVWVLIPGRRNEALDLRVYAYAALCGLEHLGLKLNARADRGDRSPQPREAARDVDETRETTIERSPPARSGDLVAPPPPRAARRGGGWLGDRGRGGWLR